MKQIDLQEAIERMSPEQRQEDVVVYDYAIDASLAITAIEEVGAFQAVSDVDDPCGGVLDDGTMVLTTHILRRRKKMSDNYLEFSEIIEFLIPEEIQWWGKELKCAEKSCNEDNYEEYAWLHNTTLEKDKKQVWFHADEFGDLEVIANIVQKFLKVCRPYECFSLTWTCHCSEPQTGEFDGGAMFVTAEEIKLHSSYEWIKEQRDKWKNDK